MTIVIDAAEYETSKKSHRLGRSPGYPAISLPKALTRVGEFYRSEGKYAVPLESVFKAWGYGIKSSGARTTLSALRYFGLLDYLENDTSKVQLTKLALDIQLDFQSDSLNKQNLIKQAALNPKIHKELWDMYQTILPSDHTIMTYLVRDRDFNEQAAIDLISEYKETLTFSKLDVESSIPEIVDIQDTTNYSGSTSIESASVENQSAQSRSVAYVTVNTDNRLNVGQNERLYLSGPLSKDGNTTYRLLVTGDIGPKELAKLVKIFKLQQELLSDEDDIEDFI